MKQRKGEVNEGVLFFGVIIIVLFLVYMVIGIRIVPATSVGVKVTMGKPNQTVLQPGAAWVAVPFQHIVKITTQQQSESTKTQCFTSDLQTTDVSYTCTYRFIGDKAIDIYTGYKGEIFKGFISPKIEEAIKQVTSVHAAEQIVKKRQDIKESSMKLFSANMPPIVEIVSFQVTNIDLSDQLESAIEKKMVVEQEALTKKFELDKASKDAEIQIAKAKGEAETLNIKGDALRKTPMLIALEAMKLWDGKMPSTVMLNGSAMPVFDMNKTIEK